MDFVFTIDRAIIVTNTYTLGTKKKKAQSRGHRIACHRSLSSIVVWSSWADPLCWLPATNVDEGHVEDAIPVAPSPLA
jgi:hypothetical protein